MYLKINLLNDRIPRIGQIYLTGFRTVGHGHCVGKDKDGAQGRSIPMVPPAVWSLRVWASSPSGLAIGTSQRVLSVPGREKK